jgi:small-conductance mechanosensitive channel
MDAADLLTRLRELEPWVSNTVTEMLQPWRMIQIAICIALIALSWLIARAAHPRLDAWMRERTMSKTQARLLILIRDRLMGLILAAATWGVALGMREITRPSRSYLIGVLAGLVTAWVLIGIASRMFRSRPLRQLVRRTGRVVASLALLGLLPHAIDLLDAAALDIGGTRVSMLLALKSAVIFVAPLWLANGVSRAAGRRLAGLEDISPSMRVLGEKAVSLLLYGIVIA